MAEFVCRVGMPSGEVREETYLAESEEALRRDLERREVHVFKVRRKGAAASTFGVPRLGRKRVSKQQFLVFNQELVTLIRAGLPLVNCLDILLERMAPSPFRRALVDIRERVRAGASLSEAFAAQGEMFPRIYSHSLTAGERSGELHTVIARFVRDERKLGVLRRKVVAAMVYPGILLTASLGAMSVLVFFAIPRFATIYTDFGKELPQLTQIVMGVSGFLTDRWYWLLVGLVGGVFSLRFWASTEAGGLTLDRLRMRLPVLGGLWQKFVVSQITRTLSTLLAGGIPLVTSLQITSQAQTNRVVSSRIARAASDVREGNPLWDSLEKTGFMTSLSVEMVKVGEATGSLEGMLANIADFYDEDIDQRLTTLLPFVEYGILFVMGILIAILVLAMYLPIFSTVKL